MKRLLVILLAAFLAGGCDRGTAQQDPAPATSSSAQVGQLDNRFEPLVSDFEAAADKVRVLALLSPT